eukprot:1321179-Amorphochlora_amoeboformis.AAC.1
MRRMLIRYDAITCVCRGFVNRFGNGPDPAKRPVERACFAVVGANARGICIGRPCPYDQEALSGWD